MACGGNEDDLIIKERRDGQARFPDGEGDKPKL